MKTYIFSGQGIQMVGMGKGIFNEFSELSEIADDILGYDIEKLCLEGPIERLSQTIYTQPAIYVVNAMHYLDNM